MDLSIGNSDAAAVIKALDAPTRVEILQLLGQRPLTVTELARKLQLSKGVVSRHMQMLELAQLIKPEENHRGFTLATDQISLVMPHEIQLPYQELSQNIPLGTYTNFHAESTCGLASAKTVIGIFDDPRSFALPNRAEAELLWLTNGYVEYLIPNRIDPQDEIKLLELSFEASSEFPSSKEDWPSDLTFYFNDIKFGTWTAPGNFSDVRGRLTPAWWDSQRSQYGLLKHLRIGPYETSIDGEQLSKQGLPQLNLPQSQFIKLRIEANGTTKHPGGMTLYGKSFGNHPQDMLLKTYYTGRVQADSLIQPE